MTQSNGAENNGRTENTGGEQQGTTSDLGDSLKLLDRVSCWDGDVYLFEVSRKS